MRIECSSGWFKIVLISSAQPSNFTARDWLLTSALQCPYYYII
jgi:hypothetical protein